MQLDKLKEEIERTKAVMAKGQKILDLINAALEKREQDRHRNMISWK